MSKKKKEERKGGRRKIKGKKGEGKREGGKIIWESGSVYPCRSESIHIVPIFSGTHKNVYFSQFPYLYDEDKNTKYLNRWFHALNEIIYRKNLEDVQFSSVAQSCPTLCNPMDCSTPGLNVHHQLREFTQTHVHCVSDAIQPSLLSPSPPALKVPSIRVFSSESALCISWPKDWSFSFNISPSNEHPGLISFRMDWLDLLAVQGALKSLLQHHSSKASILQCSAFCTVQLSHPYMTTGESLA